MTWKARGVLVSAFIEWPDGTVREVKFPLSTAVGKPGGFFRQVRVQVLNERETTYDSKIKTTQGVVNVQRGSRLSVAGKPLDLDLTEPAKDKPLDHDNLKVIPPPLVRALDDTLKR